MSKLIFSVLISVYYNESISYFKKSLDSILYQTLLPAEVVLVKDGILTDDLNCIVKEYSQKYPILKVISLPVNQGLGKALNEGLKHCSYDLVARMDTDDIAMPDRLEKEEAYMEAHPEVDVVGGAIREFNDEGTIDRVKNMPKTQEEILEYVKVRNPLNHMTVMYRKDSILKAGNYKHFPFLEDYSLWSRMLSQGYQFRNMEDILVRARTSMGLVKRRSGWAYYKDFQKLRKQQHELGITNTFEYIKAQVGTFVVLMMPGWMKEYSYKRFLRKSE